MPIHGILTPMASHPVCQCIRYVGGYRTFNEAERHAMHGTQIRIDNSSGYDGGRKVHWSDETQQHRRISTMMPYAGGIVLTRI